MASLNRALPGLMKLFLCLSFISPLVKAQQIIHFDDLDWTVSNNNNASVKSKWQNTAHAALFNHGVIADPIKGKNDINELWVQRSNWTWTSAPVTNLIRDNIQSYWLVFKGVDTFAHVKVCNQDAGDTASMYRNYAFDVTDILMACDEDPVIEVNFGSASKIALELEANGDDAINQANGYTGEEFDGRAYVRKQQNDFGWDWSPALAPVGPWQPADLVQLIDGGWFYIRNVLYDVYRQGQRNNKAPDQNAPWVLNMSCDYLGNLPKKPKLHLILTDMDGNDVLSHDLGNVYHSKDQITGSIVIDPSIVQLWWPNGMGDQPLYVATVNVRGGDGKLYSAIDRRIGFRTIVLNNDEVTEEEIANGVAPGAHWHFEVNGQPFYAKGSNFVPPDVFWPRVNQTHIRQLFQTAKEGNQNMLRIWSSGTYLPDFVYNIADELGLLMWSEFQFSDAAYPADEDFLANVEAEAYHQIRRLNHHASVALWAGGNELETIILNGGFFEPGNEVLENYLKIQTELLIKCVYANTRAISYIPSSTYHGYTALDYKSVRPQTPRWLNSTSDDALYANTDYYNYDASVAFDMSTYPVGRFANEFGFISMPSEQTWAENIPAGQLSTNSDMVVHHNRHLSGSGTEEEQSRAGLDEMYAAVPLYYPAPNLQDSVANFTAWCYTTQVFQADFYKQQIAYYRRGSGLRERQMGALYWQLDDLWAAPTWSTIDVAGRNKVSYYATKDIFKPIIVYPYFNGSTKTLEIWVTSDLFTESSGSVAFSWLNYAGNSIKVSKKPTTDSEISGSNNKFRVPVTVGSLTSVKVAEYDKLYNLFTDVNGGAANALLRVAVTANNAQNKHVAYFHPLSLAKSQLKNPGLTVNNNGDGTFTVTAKNAVAAYVWLDVDVHKVKGYFFDNGFWLNKGESRKIGFKVWEDWSGDGSWANTVSVRSLWDNNAA